MIRRDAPRGSEKPEHWLLITQREHARVSHELAAGWDPAFLPESVREEFFAAVLHHDAGWASWEAAPGVDPEHGRPYSFTEMPTEAAQRIWSDSIEACRAFGPLAGWVVSAHFSALQSKRDGDYPEWVDWLTAVDRRRAGWLTEWLAASESHTEELADRCLAWLQAFDWMSLWLCCLCPARRGDEPVDPLTVGGDLDKRLGWPEVTFTPTTVGAVRVEPWPFVTPTLKLSTPVYKLSQGMATEAVGWLDKTEPTGLSWRLMP